MLALLMFACAGDGKDTATAPAATATDAFLADYGELQCVRLAECDKHFDDHFETVEECEVTLGESLADFADCSVAEADVSACLAELGQVDCEAVLRNELPACDVSIWSCP